MSLEPKRRHLLADCLVFALLSVLYMYLQLIASSNETLFKSCISQRFGKRTNFKKKIKKL